MNDITGKQVMASGAGHNYHLFRSCYGNKLGQGYHVSVGHDIYRTSRVTVETAVEMGYFACRVCYRRAGLTIPAAADRVKVRAAKREARMAAKAAKAEAAVVAETAAVIETAAEDAIQADADALMAEIQRMLDKYNALVNA